MELERYEQVWFESYRPEFYDDEGYHLLFGPDETAANASGVSLGEMGFASCFGTLLFALVMIV